jgi:hypothetical protein
MGCAAGRRSVVGGQVGDGAAANVFVVDPHGAGKSAIAARCQHMTDYVRREPLKRFFLKRSVLLDPGDDLFAGPDATDGERIERFREAWPVDDGLGALTADASHERLDLAQSHQSHAANATASSLATGATCFRCYR